MGWANNSRIACSISKSATSTARSFCCPLLIPKSHRPEGCLKPSQSTILSGTDGGLPGTISVAPRLFNVKQRSSFGDAVFSRHVHHNVPLLHHSRQVLRSYTKEAHEQGASLSVTSLLGSVRSAGHKLIRKRLLHINRCRQETRSAHKFFGARPKLSISVA